MKLGKLTRMRPATATIDVLGDPITVTYDRSKINGRDNRGQIRAALTRILLSWDITDDEGKPYQPPENMNGEREAAWAELLAPIPDDVLNAIWIGILDDLYAGNAVRSDSAAT